jgi:hypothetical protein
VDILVAWVASRLSRRIGDQVLAMKFFAGERRPPLGVACLHDGPRGRVSVYGGETEPVFIGAALVAAQPLGAQTQQTPATAGAYVKSVGCSTWNGRMKLHWRLVGLDKLPKPAKVNGLQGIACIMRGESGADDRHHDAGAILLRDQPHRLDTVSIVETQQHREVVYRNKNLGRTDPLLIRQRQKPSKTEGDLPCSCADPFGEVIRDNRCALWSAA